MLGDVFERARAHDHIRLADWADLLLLYPASANHIARLRAGIADDLIVGEYQPTWRRPGSGYFDVLAARVGIAAIGILPDRHHLHRLA